MMRLFAILLIAIIAQAADSPSKKGKGATTPSPVDGDWQGVLVTGEQKLRLALHVRTITANKPDVRIDSIDQGINSLAGTNASFDGAMLKFDIPAIQARYEGKLSTDRNTMTGVWSQGRPLPLDFKRASNLRRR